MIEFSSSDADFERFGCQKENEMEGSDVCTAKWRSCRTCMREMHAGWGNHEPRVNSHSRRAKAGSVQAPRWQNSDHRTILSLRGT